MAVNMSMQWFEGLVLLFIISSITALNGSHVSRSTNSLNKDDEDCEIVLETFALVSANYTFCAIRSASPVKLCQLCVDKYMNVISSHDDILNLEDEDGNKCKDNLINLDKLQVVESGFDYVVGLWQRANCNDCYEIDDKGNPSKELKENTKEILNLSNLTQNCINKYPLNETTNGTEPLVCSACKQFYLDLNTRYDSLKDQGFCMDIVDLVNKTRLQWSIDLRCCLERKQPEWLFLVSSGVFTCLPIVFYIAAFMLVSRKEQTVLKRNMILGVFSLHSMSPAQLYSHVLVGNVIL